MSGKERKTGLGIRGRPWGWGAGLTRHPSLSQASTLTEANAFPRASPELPAVEPREPVGGKSDGQAMRGPQAAMSLANPGAGGRTQKAVCSADAHRGCVAAVSGGAGGEG